MPRLLVINGLPGSGKSTLASLYAEKRALSLCLDVDVVRGLLGAWQEQPSEAGSRARRLALAMAHVALVEGVDVVVPQFLLRTTFLDQLAALADACGASFHEAVLLDPPARARARLEQRARHSTPSSATLISCSTAPAVSTVCPNYISSSSSYSPNVRRPFSSNPSSMTLRAPTNYSWRCFELAGHTAESSTNDRFPTIFALRLFPQDEQVDNPCRGTTPRNPGTVGCRR